MVKTSGALPEGIALVRVETPPSRIFELSPKLTHDEARLARAVAGHLVRAGAKVVVLTDAEVAGLVLDADE